MTDDLTPVVVPCGRVVIRCWNTTEYLETVWAANTRYERRVPAAPNTDAATLATAAQTGYGADTWALSRDHEALHTWLAVQSGLPCSPTLKSVAYGYKLPRGMLPDEEAHILAFQAALNGADADPDALTRLTVTTNRDLPTLLAAARSFLATLQEG